MYNESSKPYTIALTLEESTKVFNQLLANPNVTVDDLTITVEHTLDMVEQFGIHAIDLKSLPSDAKGEHLAVMLRAISSWREELPDWHNAITHTKEVLIKEGEDYQDVLYGLIS